MKTIEVIALLAAFSIPVCTAGCGSGNKTEPEKTPVTTTEATTETVEVPELDGYTLLWNDEFSGSVLDESKWNY